MAKPLDITGQRFERLVAIRHIGRTQRNGRIWEFRCDCGALVSAILSHVRNGDTKSCGCLVRDRMIAMNIERTIEHLPREMVVFDNHKSNFEWNVIPEPNSGCWLWVGTWDEAGYGRMKINGNWFMAHRVSYEIHKGKIADGLHLDHICEVKSCVNPDHLEAVDTIENTHRYYRRRDKNWVPPVQPIRSVPIDPEIQEARLAFARHSRKVMGVAASALRMSIQK